MPKRKTSFGSELKEKFPCFRSGRNNFEAECLTCGFGTFVSVANKGSADLEAHMATTKHKKAIRSSGGSSSKVTDFFVKPGSQCQDQVAAAEATMAFHSVRHHHSYNSNDCTSKLVSKIFPDSEVSRKYACARTKIEAVVNNVIAPFSINSILNDIESGEIMYLGVATDGSNHKSTKLFPIVIQYFDWQKGGLQSKLIEVKSTTDECAVTIATEIKKTLTEKGLFEKCVSFTGDNCNTNFGGLRRKETGNNVFAHLKKDKPSLVGIGCPAHILNNCIHHGVNQLSIDIESVIYKVYQHFSIYTVRTEALKEYCDFVDINYKKLLSHSATRWLSLYPGLTRLLQMYPALKSYFLSIEKPPVALKKFFENEVTELYLWHLQSVVCIFHETVAKIERSKNSVIEILECLFSVGNILKNRQSQQFVSIKVKSMLKNLRDNGFSHKADEFMTDVSILYSSCEEYLNMWTTSLKEFNCFQWITLARSGCSKPDWEMVESSLLYLLEKNIKIDDAKLFDQFHCLMKFVETQDEKFDELLCHEKWTLFFKSCKNKDFYSELLIIAQFYFCIMAHNANVERIFSLMQPQWSKERDNLLVSSVEKILIVQYNFADLSCRQFYDIVESDTNLLKKIKSTEKYEWAKATSD